LTVPEIDTTNAVAVFLLLLGTLAAVRAAMPTRAVAAKKVDADPDSDQAESR
jgi:hypothetical protein